MMVTVNTTTVRPRDMELQEAWTLQILAFALGLKKSMYFENVKDLTWIYGVYRNLMINGFLDTQVLSGTQKSVTQGLTILEIILVHINCAQKNVHTVHEPLQPTPDLKLIMARIQ